MAAVYADILRLASLADAVGFDSIWVSEHHGTSDSHIPSPIVMLAAIAAVTHRIRLGSGIAIGPFQDPIRFAEDCCVVDQLSGGRLMVGVGPGWRDAEFRAFGIPVSERIARTAELVAFCRQAWSTGSVTMDGRFIQVSDVVVSPMPCGPLPILLGGGVPAAAARAGRLADGYIAPPLSDPVVFAELVAAFDEGARSVGRDPLTMPIGFQVSIWVSPDGSVPDEVWRAMWHKMGSSLRWHADEAVGSVGDLPPMDTSVLARRAIVGTPDEVTARLRPFIQPQAGRDLHVLARIQHAGLPFDMVAPAVRLFAETVLPELRPDGTPPAPVPS